MQNIPYEIEITLSDVSEGMLRDTRRELGGEGQRFSFHAFDCHKIPYESETFDVVIANHVLFYCQDIPKVCREVKRVLKQGGVFVCSTYGNQHMKEVSLLVQEFDNRIVLSADRLYERFGMENGREILEKCFQEVEWRLYEDSLLVTEAEALISYILSCHGNQAQYIGERYTEFRSFVKEKTEDGFYITKEAGIFLCENR